MTSECQYQTDAARWQAVRTKDHAAQNSFVYCVKSTKIYCRPTCSARLARRSNVEYHRTSGEAELAGYRACKRCKPELAVFIPEIEKMMRRIRDVVDDLDDDEPLPTLEMLAKKAGLTKAHFHRTFKKATGMTPTKYALARRLGRKGALIDSEGVLSDRSSVSWSSVEDQRFHSPAALTPEFLKKPIIWDDWIVGDPEGRLGDASCADDGCFDE